MHACTKLFISTHFITVTSLNLLKNLIKIYILCVRKLSVREVKSVAKVTQIERPMLGAELDYSTNQALKPCHTAYSNCQACLDRQLLRGVSGGNR